MLKKREVILIGLSIVLIVSFLSAQEIERTDYKIGPKDLLEINVFGLEELNRTERVSEEGKITLPLLGEIDVEDLTKGELEKKISQLLEEKYLQDPQVSVFIVEYQSKMVSVLGAIQTPGRHELLGRQTVMDIIAKAGGLTSEAGDEIYVMRRRADGSNSSVKISIDELILYGKAELNIPLKADDVINIPIDKIIQIYVMGQVGDPGALGVRRSMIPTLLRAIAQAGGFGERAAKGGVIIKRIKEDGSEERIKVNVKDIIKGKKEDIQLKEGDVVIVPETIF
jgi:polysaccharide export outer membrane protein